jgi:tetratricopeptide (TPR) repeat protein
MNNSPRFCFAFALLLASLSSGAAQTAQSRQAQAPKPDRASAYYHAALGHLYAELAAQFGGRGEYLQKAIENYRLAVQHDPEASSLAEELAELYVQSGQLRSAVAEFEEAVKRNPEDVNARRILGRLYTARIREGQSTRMNEDMIKAAVQQYEKVVEKAPGDRDAWLMLGRLYKLLQNSPASERAFKKVLEIDENDEDALTGLAMVYSDLGDTASASQVLKRVAEKSPNVRTLLALASAYEQLRQFKEAAETYRKALELNPDNLDLKRAYAQSLFAADETEKARAVFEELLEAEPNDLLALLRLSQICRQQQDYACAEQYAQRASRLDPTNLEVQYNEVSLLEAQGKLKEAIARLKEILAAIERRPSSFGDRTNRVILLERLGLLYRMAEQTQEAVAAFREMAQVDPDSAPRAAAQIIDTLRAAKDFAAADREAKAALQKYPQDRLVKTLAATVATDLGRFHEAESMLKGMLDGKNDREVWISLAQVYEKQKNWAEMARALDRAFELSSTPEEKEAVLFMRGAMFERQKKYDLAEAEFRKVLELNPKSASALNYLGYMLADRNVRLQEALELIQKAVALEPNNSAFLDSLGWVYYRLNRLEEAAEYLQKSLARGSRDPTVHDHMGDVYSSMGRLKEAVVHWERSLEEWHANAPVEIDHEEIARIRKKLENAKMRLAREGAARQND